MKFKADWIDFGKGLGNEDHVLVVKAGDGLGFDPSNNLVPDHTVLRNNKDTYINAKYTYITFPELPDAVPPSDLAPVTKKYVESKLRGLVWRWPVFCADQLDSSATGGIRPACRLVVVNSTDLLDQSTIYCSYTTPDGTKRYFDLVFSTSTTGPGVIDISDSPDVDTVATRIVEAIQSLAADGNQSAAYMSNYSAAYGDRVYFIYTFAQVITDLKVWVSDDIEKCVQITLPNHDNIGRPYTILDNNETHFAEENDVAYTWDRDTDTWIVVSGSGSIPYATKDVAGKVRPLDGLVVASGDIAVALSPVSGLELAGTSPNKTLEISDSIAGPGLTITDKVLSIQTGTGLSIDSNGNLNVDATGFIDTTRGLDVDPSTNKLFVNLVSGGGLLYDTTTGGLRVDPSFVEVRGQYAVQLDTLTYAQGYIVLPKTPDNPLVVEAYIANGLRLISQDVVTAYSLTVTPDYVMCPVDGYKDHFVFANGVTIGTWTSSGLSDIIASGDILFIVYEVK